MSRPSYIGVTGFTNRSDVLAALDAFGADAGPRLPGEHQLMVGVLASQKTLRGEKNKYSTRYPKMDRIGSIFVGEPGCLNLVHYSVDSPDEIGTLPRQLEELAEHFRYTTTTPSGWLHGIQLNMRWPDPAVLAEALSPRWARVVLQVGPRALEDTGGARWRTPEQADNAVVFALEQYLGLITDVLIDVSGGKGLTIDPTFAMRIVRHLRSAFPGLGVGVAGGLDSASVPNLLPLAQATRFSLDAEGRLRDPETDELDLARMRAYLQAAKALFMPRASSPSDIA